ECGLQADPGRGLGLARADSQVRPTYDPHRGRSYAPRRVRRLIFARLLVPPLDGAIDDQEALERLKRAMAEGESQRIEFIDDLPEDPKELGKEIAALATSNQGAIYLGISNDTKPVGVAGISGPTDAVGKDYYSRRIADIAGAVDPPIQPDIEFIHYNGKIIVEIFVPKGAKPVYSYHFRPYLRYIT